ncbi:MAG: hypothetical protein IT435_16170 [Phycisphaerales bacterium]|nr:hypothetical protein [Phycisphaerales bacterium]
MKTARRGSIYIIVLSTALTITVLTIGAIWVNRTDAVARIAQRDEAGARRLAYSAVELALANAQNTVYWRTSAAAPLFTDLSLGEGRVSASVTDPVDGNLSNNLTDSIAITGTGFAGASRQMMKLTASVSDSYLTCLDGGIHAGGAMTIGSAIVRSATPIGANGNVTATGSTVKADVYSAGTINGSTYSGAKSPGVTAKVMPPSDVFTQYAGIATTIPYNSLASGRIRRCLLSAASNPYGGGTNSRGVYLVDCGNQPLQIFDCRIAATLIVTNCSSLEVTSSVNWTPSETGLPALLVSGSVRFNMLTLDLMEASFGVNFNPSGNPYLGVTDSDQVDRFPSIIHGLVYASGAIIIDQRLTAIGTIVAGGNVTIGDTAIVSMTRLVTGSPPCFVMTAFRIDSTSWARQVD